MHAITKLKWKWRYGNTASNEQRKSKGTIGATSCHSLGRHTTHVNTTWANEHDNTNWVHCTSTTPSDTAHDNTNWAHCTCQQQLGTVHISNASVNTNWAYYTCEH